MPKPQLSTSRKLVTILLIVLTIPITIFLVQHARGVQGSASLARYTIYEDALAAGWKARSSASRINLANPSPVYAGSKSISFTPTRRGARLYLYTKTAVDTSLYASLHFAAQASRAGQDDTVVLYDAANKALSTVRLAHYGGDPVSGTWKVYDIALSDLRANATHITGLAIQSRTKRHGTVYLDSISFTGSVSSSTSAVTATPTFSPTPVPRQATATATATATTPTSTTATSTKTVFLILMENHNWSDIKNSPSAPYINTTLLPMASYAEQYYNPPGNHPSEPNYLWLEAGTNFGIGNDDNPDANHQGTTQHLVTLLNTAHISWKSYQEDISGTLCPLTGNGLYAPKHNPMVFFDDVTNTNDPHSSYCIAHVRPYSELITDLQQQTQARYNFITPNLCNDMHDSCAPLNNPVKQGDTWLAQNLPPILDSQAYKNGGIVFITWDEGEGGDGPIGMIVLSPDAKGGGYANTIHYTHSSTLRTLEEIFGVSPLLSDAANATDLRDLFKTFP